MDIILFRNKYNKYPNQEHPVMKSRKEKQNQVPGLKFYNPVSSQFITDICYLVLKFVKLKSFSRL